MEELEAREILRSNNVMIDISDSRNYAEIARAMGYGVVEQATQGELGTNEEI